MVISEGDISSNFTWNRVDASIIGEVLRYENTPFAIQCFAENCGHLTDYGYWFTLGTLWVSYSGLSNLNLWKRLLRSDRPKRNKSIMKPSEWEVFKQLPDRIRAYRTHQPGETDWISYTLDNQIAKQFAHEKGVNQITEYELRKKDVIALFLRRGEKEILMLDPGKAMKAAELEV